MSTFRSVSQVDSRVVSLAHSWWRRRRLRAVDELTTAPASGAVALLADLLWDRRSGVADAAADALRVHFGADGRAALLEALTSKSELARLAAARTLAYDREPRALAALDEAMRGPDLDQWGPAVERMELFGDAALPIFQRELLDEENGPRMLREMCAGALLNVAGEKARPALEQAASSRDRFVAQAARKALGQLGEQ